MTLIKFLADKKVSVFCFTLLMLFISMVMRLDSFARVSAASIVYINLVSFSFFTLYLIASYAYYRRYYKSLSQIIEYRRDEIINRLPKPRNHEQALIYEVLLALHNEESLKLQAMHQQKKDYEEFITRWVHEVKNPISVSRLLIESSISTPNKETLYSLEEEVDKIDNYIEQALYYSKADEFSKDYLINEVELERLVKEAIKKHAKTFINKRINVEINDIALEVTTDKKWLSFIFDQILSNALKYTPQDGNIKIYGLVEDKVKKLIIEDTGVGIKPEDINRVFNKGFTGYNGRENYKSTGIGLYLSKKLAQKLGHDIAIESKYGEYTKVAIVFPKLTEYFQVAK